MTDVTPLISALHDDYCRLTGLSVPLTMMRILTWQAWLAAGMTKPDLALTVRHMKNLVAQGRMVRSFRFDTFIGRPEDFQCDLAEARALARRPVRDAGRESVLRATGRSTPEPDRARSAADIIAGLKAFEEFKRLKQSL